MRSLFSLLSMSLGFHAFAELPPQPALPSYFLCMNAQGLSDAPTNVMVMASPLGITGLFNAANTQPPRVFFNAAFVSKQNLISQTYGAVVEQNFAKLNYDSSHRDSFPCFTSVKVNFFTSPTAVEQGKMASVEFTRDSGPVLYDNCVKQSN